MSASYKNYSLVTQNSLEFLAKADNDEWNIVIYDIPNAEGMIKGKALDISQLCPLDGYDASISGTSNPEDMKNSDVI